MTCALLNSATLCVTVWATNTSPKSMSLVMPCPLFSLNGDNTLVYVRILPYGDHNSGGQNCSDWEKGANHITLCQRKWLLQQDLHIQVYVLVFTKYASLVGVVTCVGKKWYDEQLSLNHCNTFLALKMAAIKWKYTEVSGMWRHMRWVYTCISMLMMCHRDSSGISNFKGK